VKNGKFSGTNVKLSKLPERDGRLVITANSLLDLPNINGKFSGTNVKLSKLPERDGRNVGRELAGISLDS
jgi:hypothetical protein